MAIYLLILKNDNAAWERGDVVSFRTDLKKISRKEWWPNFIVVRVDDPAFTVEDAKRLMEPIQTVDLDGKASIEKYRRFNVNLDSILDGEMVRRLENAEETIDIPVAPETIAAKC